MIDSRICRNSEQKWFWGEVMIRKSYGEFMKNLVSGRFAFTGEIEPGKTADLTKTIKAGRLLKGSVLAVNITDCPMASGHMNSLVPSYVIQKEVGIETIYQVTCRDRNRIAIFADLLAAGALGIVNVLALSGDYTTHGDLPEAKPVFDLDSISLIHMIRKITDEGKDLGDNEIEQPPKFHVGAVANPCANPIEPEIVKIEKKVNMGVEFIQTQVVYDIETAREFLDNVKHLKVPILIGIFPLRSSKAALWMNQHCPEVNIPVEFMDKLRRTERMRDKNLQESRCKDINIQYFGQFVKELRKNTKAAGCHIMAAGFEEITRPIVKASEME